MDIDALTKNCCSFDSGNAVIANLGNKYATIVIDLNDKNLTSPQFYIDKASAVNGGWRYILKDGNGINLGSIDLVREIVSIVKAGFNGVMYAGPNIINKMSFNFDSVVNINELNASKNKILYIEVEL